MPADMAKFVTLNTGSSSKYLISLLELNLPESGKQQGSVNPLSNKFQGNTLLVHFQELKFFTSYTQLGHQPYGAFPHCSNLKDVDVRNITYLWGGTGASYKNFYGTKIETVIFPKITKIQQYALQSSEASGTTSYVRNPKIYVFGKDFSQILSQYAFCYTYYKKILIYAKTPATGAVLATNGTQGTQIFVPDDVYDDYYAAEDWAKIKGKLKRLSEYTDEKPWEELYPEELGLI